MTNSILSSDALEEWRDICGYEGYYQVSSFGRVRSLDRYALSSTGQNRLLRGKLIKLGKASGYFKVDLSLAGSSKTFYVHRLVAAAFIGVCVDGFQVNHDDGNKLNNHVGNLEYCTPKQNMQHAIKAGLKVHHKGSSKFTHDEIRTIRLRAKSGEAYKSIAKEFGVHLTSISAIARHITWSHII